MSAPVPKQPPPSAIRAWFALVGLSLRRQARVRQMVWVSLGLLGIAVLIVGLQTARSRWSTAARRFNYVVEKPAPTFLTLPRGEKIRPVRREDWGKGIVHSVRFDQMAEATQLAGMLLSSKSPMGAVPLAQAAAEQAALSRTPVYNFTRAIMFSPFIGFLLPIWCLSFATEALGGEREGRTMVWLLSRPLPRWGIFLAKYAALLPWAMGLNVGGFGLMCLAAGPPGTEVFHLYWPAVVAGTLAFTALFHLFAAATNWPTVVGLVYCFFLEAMLGDMPGLMKRVSISFYIRCLIFDAAADYGVTPDKPTVYLPVGGAAAWTALASATLVALAVGAVVFSRVEYRDDG